VCAVELILECVVGLGGLLVRWSVHVRQCFCSKLHMRPGIYSKQTLMCGAAHSASNLDCILERHAPVEFTAGH
jgi:hypothetical protein